MERAIILIILILQLQQQNLREVNELVPGYTACVVARTEPRLDS